MGEGNEHPFTQSPEQISASPREPWDFCDPPLPSPTLLAPLGKRRLSHRVETSAALWPQAEEEKPDGSAGVLFCKQF